MLLNRLSRVLSLTLLLSLSLLGHARAAWELDPAHSMVGFSVRHLAVSKVRGMFNQFSGTLTATPKGQLTKVTGVVKTASIDTNNERRDEHLRSDDFFNTAEFPDIKFTSTKIVHKGKNVTVTGNLTIRKTTKSVTFKGAFNGMSTVDFGRGPEKRMGYSLSGVINRKAFGLNFSRMANGVLVVADDVTLELEMEAVSR